MRLTDRHELYSAGRFWPLTGIRKYQINWDEIWLDGQSCFLHWRTHTGGEFVLQDLFTQKPEGTSMARRTLWSTEGLKLATNPDAGVRLSQRALWYWHRAVQTAWVPIGTHWGIFEIRTVEWKCLASIGWVVVQFKQRAGMPGYHRVRSTVTAAELARHRAQLWLLASAATLHFRSPHLAWEWSNRYSGGRHTAT